MSNLKTKIAVIVSSLMVIISFSPALVLAADTCDANGNGTVSNQEAILCGSNQASGSNQSVDKANKSLDSTIHNLVNLISMIVGIVAVIMIIVGGFRYVTSAGNQEKTKSAKNTILYALIGLVVVALAQTIVAFTLNKTTQDCTNGKTSSGQKC